MFLSRPHGPHHDVRKPRGFVDRAAYSVVSLMRLSFDMLSGYKLQRKLDTLDERSVLNRFGLYCLDQSELT